MRVQSGTGWAEVSLRPGNAQPGWLWQTANSPDMRMWTGGADRIIKGDGKVGIGARTHSR